MAQKVKPEIFDILKSLVDKKVPVLRRQLVQGVDARHKIVSLQSQISDLQKYVVNNRYDRAEVLETEELIYKYEQDIKDLKEVAIKSDFAHRELNESAKFYTTYKIIRNKSKLDKLHYEYNILDERADKLNDLMFVCEINMDQAERSPEVYEQASDEMKRYEAEYLTIINRMNQITKEIKSLTR